MAWRLFRDKRVAILSPAIFLTALLVYGIGTYAVLDPMISVTADGAGDVQLLGRGAGPKPRRQNSLATFYWRGLRMGVMTKGFLALAVPVVGVLPW
ncbi:phospholipid carrier-dependent glycosyltransferase [Escherichia coli]